MKFLKVRFLSSNGLLFLLSLIGVLFINMLVIGNLSQIPIIALVIFSLYNLIVLAGILWGLTAKVELSESGIGYKSIFRKVYIDWAKIESFGIYVTGSNVKYTLDKADYYKFIWAGQKFIFVTEQKDFEPAMFRRRPKTGYIDFHFRKEACEMIERKIKESLRPIG